MPLSILSGRDNNLNLIRLVAAAVVLWSHAWPIALGPDVQQPFEAWSGISAGRTAVLLFFFISGFLVTGSLMSSGDIGRFAKARIARLFPAFGVCIVVTALVLGPLTTDLDPSAYFAHPDVGLFLLRNLGFMPMQYDLPGVFSTNPYPAVHGSVWTLFYEAACYAALAGLFYLGLTRTRARATVALGLWAAISLVFSIWDFGLPYRIEQTLSLSFHFAAGGLFWLGRDRIPTRAWIAVGSFVPVVLARNTPFAEPFISVSLGYFALWLAVQPLGPFFNRFRSVDYSYGLYLYAFPVQGLMVWLFGPMNPWLNTALALPVSLALAALSWHLVERPSLKRFTRPRRDPMARSVPAGA